MAAKKTETATTEKTVKATKTVKSEKPAKTVKKTAKADKVYKSRIQEMYEKEVVPALTEKFGYKNPMQVPKLVKIVLDLFPAGTAVNI